MKAAITTLGCRLNQADSALMAADLSVAGFELVPWGQQADVLVINSCAVTATADRKTGQAVRSARRRWPDAFIVLCGCTVDAAATRIQGGREADLILPNAAKNDLTRLLPDGLQRGGEPLYVEAQTLHGHERFIVGRTGLFPEHTRANLKIQEGCDFRCSYCIVPTARGPARSRDWQDVLAEAAQLVANGHRELVLTGVNIATYRERGRTLADLVARLLRLPGDFRVRLSSTEPGPILTEIIDLMAGDLRLCRSLHLPMQYGEDGILKAMNRRHTVAEFAEFALLAVERVPGLCLGTDIIVGFPGETAASFDACRRTVADLPFGYLHVFSYSPRPGTVAACLPGRVDKATATARHRALRQLGESKARTFAEEQIGQTLQALTETVSAEGNAEGWSDNYLRVTVRKSAVPLRVNSFVNARITGVTGPRELVGIPTADLPKSECL